MEEPQREKGSIRFGTVLPNDKIPEEEEFNPFDRHIEHPTTNTETYIHFIKGSIGTGCLAMPSGFKQVGYIFGLLVGIITGGLCMLTLHLLMRIKFEVSKKMRYHVVQFPDACEIVMKNGPPSLRWMAKPIPIIVDFFIFCNHLGICCVYINFIGSNLFRACHHFFPNTGLTFLHWEIITTIIMIFLNQIRNLHFLSPISTIGNFLLAIGLGLVLYFIFRDGIDIPIVRKGETELIGNFFDIPKFMGTFLFASLGIGVLIAVEDEMKTPAAYRKNPFGILNMGFVSIVAIYLTVGVLGYWKYGHNVSGSITLNIPETDQIAVIVWLIFAGVILFSYPIHFYVSVYILWTNYIRWRFDTSSDSAKNKLNVYEIIIRVMLVIISFLVTVLVPNLSFLISLVGAFCLPVLGFLVPGLLDLTINLTEHKSTPMNVFRNIFLMIFGIVFFVVGTFMGIEDVLKEK